MAVAAWKIDVKASTINNCFRHSKIRGDPGSDTAEGSSQLTAHELLLDPAVVRDLEYQVEELYHNPMDIRNLLNLPEEDEVAGVFTDDNIIATVLGGHGGDPEDADDSHELAEIKEFASYRAKDVKKMAQIMQYFFLVKEGDNSLYLDAVQRIYDRVSRAAENEKWTKKIDDYFPRPAQ